MAFLTIISANTAKPTVLSSDRHSEWASDPSEIGTSSFAGESWWSQQVIDPNGHIETVPASIATHAATATPQEAPRQPEVNSGLGCLAALAFLAVIGRAIQTWQTWGQDKPRWGWIAALFMGSWESWLMWLSALAVLAMACANWNWQLGLQAWLCWVVATALVRAWLPWATAKSQSRWVAAWSLALPVLFAAGLVLRTPFGLTP